MRTNKRIIITITHRLDYVHILQKNLAKQRDSYDEWHLWVNTADESVLEELQKIDAHIIKPDIFKPEDGLHNLYHFYQIDSMNHDTDYLKLDDDIIWFEPNFIDKIFNYREFYRNKYFLLFSNTINNAIISNIQMRLGNFLWNNHTFYNYLDPVGWASPLFAEELHKKLLQHINDNTYNLWHFNKWVLDWREMVSINSICWSGEDFSKVIPYMQGVDEFWINTYGPSMTNKNSVILGDILCSHYAFHPQKQYLDQTDILDQYKKLADSV